MFELIQYTPQTAKVRAIPLLIVPPTINKYYVIDLAEQRSLVEHLVEQGQQVFCISWRNPDARHADWGLDTYGQAIIEAMDAVAEDRAAGPGRPARHLLRRHARHAWSLAHLAATGDLGPGGRVQPRGHACSTSEQAGLPSALLSHKAAAASTRRVAARRATSTAGCWPRCSPGCAPTT